MSNQLPSFTIADKSVDDCPKAWMTRVSLAPKLVGSSSTLAKRLRKSQMFVQLSTDRLQFFKRTSKVSQASALDPMSPCAVERGASSPCQLALRLEISLVCPSTPVSVRLHDIVLLLVMVVRPFGLVDSALPTQASSHSLTHLLSPT